MKSSIWVNFLQCLFLSLIFALGCGGGTEGTGGITIDGSVRDNRQQPIAGIAVTLLDSDVSAVTDSHGNFSFYSQTQPVYEFAFEYHGTSSVAALTDVPSTATQIAVVFHLDGDKPVTVGGLTVTHANPTPSPSHSDSNEDSVTPSPTVRPTEDGGTGEDGGQNGSGQDDGNDHSTTPSPTVSPNPSSTPEPSDTPEPPDKVATTGPIAEISSDRISVNGITFVVDHDTEFKDASNRELNASDFHPGDSVLVRGEYDGGKLLAKLVKKNS